MSIPRGTIEAWWDIAHQGESPRYRSDTAAPDVLRCYKAAGLNLWEIEGPCLEIGPGRGLFLSTLPRPRYGLEVSPHNRQRLVQHGICQGVWSPYDEPQDLQCRFVSCFLVVQHCSDKMVQQLFRWARRACAPGAIFFLQTAEWLQEGRPDDAKSVLEGGGGRPCSAYLEWLTAAGWLPGSPHELNLPVSTTRWWIWKAVAQ